MAPGSRTVMPSRSSSAAAATATAAETVGSSAHATDAGSDRRHPDWARWRHRAATGSVHHHVHRHGRRRSPRHWRHCGCPQRRRRPTGGTRVHPAVPDRKRDAGGVVEPQRRSRRSDDRQPRDRRCGRQRAVLGVHAVVDPTRGRRVRLLHRGAGGLLGAVGDDRSGAGPRHPQR